MTTVHDPGIYPDLAVWTRTIGAPAWRRQPRIAPSDWRCATCHRRVNLHELTLLDHDRILTRCWHPVHNADRATLLDVNRWTASYLMAQAFVTLLATSSRCSA